MEETNSALTADQVVAYNLANPALTADQVIAYNLARARTIRGWTQGQAAGRLEEVTGVKWSKASWSAAERSAYGGRRREFTATEIVTFARVFGFPIAWWFLPPGTDRPDLPRDEQMAFLHIQVGTKDGWAMQEYRRRLAEVTASLSGPVQGDPSNPLWELLATMVRTANASSDFDFAGLRDLMGELGKAVDHIIEAKEGQS